jgi:hypothetical protein
MQTRPTKPKIETTPCEVENINQRQTMSQTPYIIQAPCCPTPPPAPIQVMNPAPNSYNPALFNYGAGNTTGTLKLHQNSTMNFVGVGVDIKAAQTVSNSEEVNTITITSLGGGTGLPYTGTGFTTVSGATINTSLASAAFGSVLPANVGFVANDNKYYTSIPASMITGLSAGTTETPNGTVTSPTVAITLSGTANRNIKADAIISVNAGNQLSNNNGLFVPAFVESVYTANAGVKKVGNNFSLDATTIPANSIPTSTINNFPASILAALNSGNNPSNGVYQISVNSGSATLTAPVAGGGTTYSGSPTITISGTNSISANVPAIAGAFPALGTAPANSLLLTASGNAYTSIPASMVTGLPSIVNTPLTANDSTTIDFITSGTDNHTLTGNIKLSTFAGNSLTIRTDGLYGAPSTSTTAYTASQGVTLVGNNFQLNGATIPNGAIPAAAISGLPTFTETPLTVQDTTSIDFTSSGVNGHQLTGFVKISTDANNLLTQTPTGLFVTGATSGGSVSTLAGDVIGTSAASTVAKIRGFNVSPTAPTAGQSLVFNGTDYVPTTSTASVSTATVTGAPSTAPANLSKFQVDSVTGQQFFVDATGNIVPLSPLFSKTIGFDTGTATTGSTSPSYVGYDVIRVPSGYSKVVLETVDFVVKNDSATTLSGSVVIEVQDDSGATICTSPAMTYPAPGATSALAILVPTGNKVRANPSRYTLKVISGGDINLGINAELTGFAGK